MNKYAQFYAIINRLGLEKAETILEFTEGRTSSLNALSEGEFKELMIRLTRMNPKGFTPKPGDEKRKKIIATAKQMGWVKIPYPGAKPKVNMDRLNQWCIHYGKYKKPLNNHTPEELSVLIAQFEKAFEFYLKNVIK